MITIDNENDKSLNDFISNAIEQHKQIELMANDAEEMLRMQMNHEKINSNHTLMDLWIHKKPFAQLFWEDYRHHQLNNIYPNILWSSLFLTSYSQLEYHFDKICKYFYETRSLLISPSLLRDRGIKRSEIYLKKVAKLNFVKDIEDSWHYIKISSDIRHCIIHANADISHMKESKPIEAAAQKLSIPIEEKRLKIKKDFVLRFNKWCQNSLQMIGQFR